MSFTRFSSDPARIKKQLEQQTFAGRYAIDVPGYGVDKMTFLEDPQIRLQGWGANLNMNQNPVDIESDLLTLSRRYNRDLVDINDHKKHGITMQSVNWGVSQPFIDESRSTHPAWMYRTVDNNRWEFPILNPQHGLEKPFNYDISTRILEKDNFKPVYPSKAT
jgi:hypothetical protein